MDKLDMEIIDLGQRRKFQELETLIEKVDTKILTDAIVQKIGRSDSTALWNSLLMGFTNEKTYNKRFIVVMAVLQKLVKVDLTTKQSFEIVTRLFIYLPSFKFEQLIEISEFCCDSIRAGDPKWTGWKDLFPEVLGILKRVSTLNVNGMPMSGQEFHSNTIKTLCSMKWNKPIITAVASMFKEISLTSEERVIILKKFCENLMKVEPLELPPLSFQLFSLCTTPSLVIFPIMAFQKYFHKHYYKKLYIEMDSDTTDLDSIDTHSDKEFREAEETVLYHLGTCTEFNLTETDVVNVFKGFSSTPQFILTPFILSAILTMCNINRYPETTRLSSSQILPFLRTVIKHNEDEMQMMKDSAWCRDTMTPTVVDFEKILTVLIEQNRDGNDVITPGLVGLSFTLLKAKNITSINKMGVTFLQKFLKKRFIFGQGIVKNLAEFLFADQDAGQYAECLATLSLTNTLTISECVDTVRSILDYFLLIPGKHAMKMIAFVFPLVKISHTIRDALIEILKKAMYHRDIQTRKLGIFGFCMLLKQLRNNNSRRTTNPGASRNFSFSQSNSISGFSLISQTALSAGDVNNPQRHLDVLTLEIVGILRKCFSQTKEIKQILYDTLNRAIEFNPPIIAHILQFMDIHFRSYFDIDELNVEIHFEMVLREKENGEIEELESLGELMYFMAITVYHCERNCLNYENLFLKKLFDALCDRIDLIELKQIGVIEPLTQKSSTIAAQFLNCFEALMAYCAWMSKPENNYLEKLLKLFKYHAEHNEAIKNMTGNKKGTKKKKKNNDSDISQTNTQNPIKPISFKSENVWDLMTLERLLRMNHDEGIQYIEQTRPLRVNRNYVCYILKETISRIHELKDQPEYKHIQHSRRIFNLICSISEILYKNCIIRLDNLSTDFDPKTAQLCAELFREILVTSDLLYRRKFNEIICAINGIKSDDLPENCYKIIEVIHGLLEKCIDEQCPVDDDSKEKISANLLDCLEILYTLIPGDNAISVKIYKWLFKFCETNKIETKNFALLHKLLFNERIKTNSGLFFNTIAIQIQNELGLIEEDENDIEFKLKSINLITAETCVVHLCTVLKKKIEEVEYFITKAKSYFTKIKVVGTGDNQDYLQSMKTIERAICSQLIHIVKTVIPLANTQLSLGASMNSLIRIITQLYICMTNLTKHLIIRHPLLNVSFNGTKFDQLVRCGGKVLANRVYGLITFIEENIIQIDDNSGNSKKKVDPLSNKTKVISSSKFIPRLILMLENFNKFVIVLSKKTKIDLSMHLHIGTVRDFRIKTADLKEAIVRNKEEHPEAFEEIDDEGEIDDDELVGEYHLLLDQNTEEENNEEPLDSQHLPTTSNNSDDNSKKSEIADPNEQVKLIMKNLKKMNKSAENKKKRSTDENKIPPPVEIPHALPTKIKRSGRKRKSDDAARDDSNEDRTDSRKTVQKLSKKSKDSEKSSKKPKKK